MIRTLEGVRPSTRQASKGEFVLLFGNATGLGELGEGELRGAMQGDAHPASCEAKIALLEVMLKRRDEAPQAALSSL